jgi:hypothetical protein
VQAILQGVYHPRDPKASDFYACVEDNFEELEQVYDEKYRKQHGFWRPVIHEVIYKYLDCGDLHQGFARVWCSACRLEFLLPYSCKGRYFCPSCHQKRAIAFAERVETELLEKVPHSQYVVTVPKMLRVYFKHQRKLLGLLSQCFYASLQEFFRAASGDHDALPGVILSIQTYGRDPVSFHPHLHCLASDGCFSRDGSFQPIFWADTEKMMRLFRHKLFQALLAKEIITTRIVDLLLSWQHPGFSVFRGEPVEPHDRAARERLVRYLLHPAFALDRLHYDPDTATVTYHPAKGSDQDAKSDSPTISSALDWLAAVVTHIPDKGQQLLRYYGHYSNVRQAQKKRAGVAAQGLQTTPQAPEQDDEFRKQCRRNWARLIKKIYEVDPLICPRCRGLMRIISFIENPPVIKKILLHLHLWEVPKRSPPAKTPPRNFFYDPDFFGGLTS